MNERRELEKDREKDYCGVSEKKEEISVEMVTDEYECERVEGRKRER